MTVTECHGTIRPRRRTICLGACLALAVAATGCSPKQQMFQIGERVQLGGIVYTVHDTEWAAELDAGGANARAAKHKFLIVHLSINNSGSKEVTLPLLNAVDAAGADHLELAEGPGVPEWLGILRPLNPTETKNGRIVFDVPVGTYNLRLTDGGEQDAERTATVALPAVSKHGNMDSPLLNEPKQ